MYSTALKMLLVLSITLMTGCQWLRQPEPEIVIQTKLVRVPITQPVLPREIELRDPEFYVVSAKNLDEFLKRVEKESGTVVFIAMSIADYELMSYNMQEIKRYVQQMQKVVVYYRRVVEDNNEKVEG